MSEIKQVNEFYTITQIRKIAQDALAPLVTKIQEQVNKVAKQSVQMRKGQQRIKNLQNTQSFIEAGIRQISKNVADLKSEIETLKSQDKKNALVCLNGIESIKAQISTIKKSEKRKQQRIKQTVDKANLVAKNFESLQNSTNLAIEKIKQMLSEVYSQTLQKVKESQKDKQQTMRIIDTTLKKLTSQRQLNEQKFKVLNLYIHERDQTRGKIQYCLGRLQETPTLQQILSIQQQVDESMRSIERADSLINDMPNRTQLVQMKRTIQQVEQKVQDFARLLELQLEVQAIKRQLEQDKTQVRGSHVHIQTVLREIEHRIEQLKKRRNQQSEESVKATEAKFRSIEQKITQFKDDFRKQLEDGMRMAISQLNHITKDFPQREKLLKKQLVQQISSISEQVQARCQKIQKLGSNLEFQLSTFGHKISKMKSDNELHQENINKEFRIFHRNRAQVDSKFISVGTILSSLTQIIVLSNSLSLFQNSNGLEQKLVYVTYSDGIICEIDPQASSDFLLYRRRQVTPFQMRKALMTGTIQFIDRVINSQAYLGWNEQKPSDFFKNHVLEHYSMHLQKSTKKQLNNASHQKLSDIQSKPIKIFGQNEECIPFVAQQFNEGTSVQILKSKQFKELQKSMQRSKQKQASQDKRNSELLFHRSSSHAKQPPLVNQSEFTGLTRTIDHSSKKGGKQKSYHIKMRKSEKEKQRFQKVYTSRSGRYSRMSYIG